MADLAETLLSQFAAISTRLVSIEARITGIETMIETEAVRCPNREKIAQLVAMDRELVAQAARIRELELALARSVGLGGALGLAASIVAGTLAKLLGLI